MAGFYGQSLKNPKHFFRELVQSEIPGFLASLNHSEKDGKIYFKIPVFRIYSILNNFLAKCVEENRNGEREKCDYHQQGPQKTSSNELIATSQMVTRGVLYSVISNI